MDDKTRKLIIALEVIALITSAVLILIDYKLKRDLLDLLTRIEGSVNGENVGNAGFPARSGDSRVRDSRVPRNDAGMETTATHAADKENRAQRSANGNPPSNGSRRNGNPKLPEPGKQMGP